MKRTIYIAVVYVPGKFVSKRQYGDWAAFMAPRKIEAIRQATDAATIWNRSENRPTNQPDYAVAVGKLEGKVVTKFHLVKV